MTEDDRSTVPASVTLMPGETVMYDITVQIPGRAPVETVEETTFVAVAQDDLSKSAATVAETLPYLPIIAR